MGENATKIEQRLEGWGSNIFSDMEWKEVTRDLEMACTRKGVHKKRTHGIDLLLEYTDPYLGVKQGIIVECKNRQMRSITLDDVNEWVSELQNLIECSHSAPELKKLNFDSEISTGMLLVHANDVFDEKNGVKSYEQSK